MHCVNAIAEPIEADPWTSRHCPSSKLGTSRGVELDILEKRFAFATSHLWDEADLTKRSDFDCLLRAEADKS